MSTAIYCNEIEQGNLHSSSPSKAALLEVAFGDINIPNGKL